MVDANGDCAAALEVGGDGVIALTAEDHPADVAEQHDPTLGPLADHQLFEFLGAAQPPFHLQRQGGGLPGGHRRFTGLSEGGQDVLGLQGPLHVVNRQLALQQRRGIQPEPEGQGTAAEQTDITDPLHPLQPLLHDLADPAVEELRCVALGIRAEAQDH